MIAPGAEMAGADGIHDAAEDRIVLEVPPCGGPIGWAHIRPNLSGWHSIWRGSGAMAMDTDQCQGLQSLAYLNNTVKELACVRR